MLDIYKYHNNPDAIHGSEHRGSEAHYRRTMAPGEAFDLLENKDYSKLPKQALLKLILTDAHASTLYALHILKGPVPRAAEKIIATEPMCSLSYARSVLHKPFPLGEPAIKTDEFFLDEYNKFLKSIGHEPITKD